MLLGMRVLSRLEPGSASVGLSGESWNAIQYRLLLNDSRPWGKSIIRNQWLK
jgi:hypothetical protein